LWLNLERTLDKRRRKDGNGEETTAEKGHHFAAVFGGKNSRHRKLIAGPDNINLSDATVMVFSTFTSSSLNYPPELLLI